MFATEIISNYDAQISNLAGKINELELMLQQLRNEKKELEAEQQRLKTLAGAGQSALDQAQAFVNIATKGMRPDMIEAFWQAMDVIRNTGAPIAEIAGTEPTPSAPTPTTVEPEVVVEVDIDQPTVERFVASVKPADPTPEPTTPQEAGEQPESVFATLSWNQVKMLAKSIGVSSKGKKRPVLEADLIAEGVEQAQVQAFLDSLTV